MVDYMISAQAEVLYEKAYNILAKYTRLTSNGEDKYPLCMNDMKLDIVKLAKKIIMSKTQEEIDQAQLSLTVYDNIINNISELTKTGVKL